MLTLVRVILTALSAVNARVLADNVNVVEISSEDVVTRVGPGSITFPTAEVSVKAYHWV